jgi:hypothetical protein
MPALTPPSPELHLSILRVPVDPLGVALPAAAWATAIAAVAAWPGGDPTTPVLERRLFRTKARGPLEHAVVAGLRDPLGVCPPAAAQAELAELLRPLRTVRPLPVAPRRLQRDVLDPGGSFVAELSRLDPALPEGSAALQPLFTSLVEGLFALEGPVGLSLLVEPIAPADDSGEAPVPQGGRVLGRGVRFLLRLFCSGPLPSTLRARAEALSLSGRANVEDWTIAMRPDEAAAARAAIRDLRPVGSHREPVATRPDIAALTLTLREPTNRAARGVLGRPVSGPLASSGAVLGRVPRPGGNLVAYRLPWSTRRQHTFVSAASGAGKTTLMLRPLLDDIDAGRTVVLVDPHGDVADQVAALIPDRRLVHIDPRRPDTAGLDLMDPDPARCAAHLLSAVTEVWPGDWAGPAWHRGVVLGTRCLALTDRLCRRPTVVDLERFYVDPVWRAEMIAGVRDRALAAELDREHRTWQQQSQNDSSMVNWISSKFTPLTQGPGAPLFRAPVGLPLEDELRAGSVIVVALPVGVLGVATTSLAVRMFLTRLTAAIAAQGSVSEPERQPVSVFVDEAHLAAGNALGGLFAQARKFNCGVTVACQTPSQLEPHLEDVLTNAETHLYGRLSLREAARLTARIGDHGARLLPRLPKHHFVIAGEDADPDAMPIVLAPAPLPKLSVREAPDTSPATAQRPDAATSVSAAPLQTFDAALTDLLS